MFKKILLGALLVGLIGVMIAGAVIRTNTRTENNTANGVGQRGRTVETARVGSESTSGQAQRGGRWAQAEQSEQGATGGGRGGGQGAGKTAPAPQTDVTPPGWLTATGTVVSVASDLVEIETTSGAVIPFEGQPLSFALGQGLILKLGDVVTVSGYDENGEFKIGKVTNLNTGATVVLRDASGRPGWAGQGRRR